MDNNRSYRIRTTVGNDKPFKIDVSLTQTYDMFEILSLKLKQKNEYNFYDANYGVIVGRVLANGNFGIPNAKVSVFIEVDADESSSRRILYNFTSAQSANLNGVRYNLLPDFVDNACHQDVGTFPNKRLVLDNNDVLEIFDKYYKYTTVTNESGDYMLFGIPNGMQNMHVDVDMSDIGKLSQRPRDMVYKGYNINQFESPNKFKESTNLNSLAQIYTQDKGVFVYSYWGNSNNRSDSGSDHIAITRCDFQIDYKFEPTCIFMGSIVTDKGSNAIGKNCTGTDKVGKMSDLAAGEGSIEMIRKTIDGKVEEYQIKGNRLIDGDGVWCYQIPMNLDYVMTDEFGNIVPTDDPSKGIPTRARVRFRISMDESPNDATARKRCRFLVPNNPRYDEVDYPQFYKTKEADYEFGSATRDESYCDMFWNNVYTVKSYIPRLQKNKNTTNRKHTGIKLINHYGDNNPMPYNSLSIKLSFTYRLICVLTKIVIYMIATINQILALIMDPICRIAKMFLDIGKLLCKLCIPLGFTKICPFCPLGSLFKGLGNLFMKMVVKGITLGSSFCDDGINKKAFYPVLLDELAQCVIWKVNTDFLEEQKKKKNETGSVEEVETLDVIEIRNMNRNSLITCVENNLAQENDATSFNFQNDWLNGSLYAPLWYRKITPKKTFLFGLFKRRAKDQWCRSDGHFNLMLYQACALSKEVSKSLESPVTGDEYDIPSKVKEYGKCNDKDRKCHEVKTVVGVNDGLILTKQTMLGQTVYYYKAIEYNQQLANIKNKDGVILLFATDIVLLGSLNDCDSNGIPQFFKNLESTTYKLPTDILFTDTIIQVDASGEIVTNSNNDIVYEQFTEATGCDWGNLNGFDECGKMGKDIDGGLFYGIGCSNIEMAPKSCLNLSRICEFGVSLDEAKDVADLNVIRSSDSGFERLTPDGFISFDELYNVNERSMFATLNGNRLRTRLNDKNGLKEYDLRYLYTDNFDGLMADMMRKNTSKNGNCNYKNNFNLEQMSKDYYIFRMGTEPYFYDSNHSLPRYENSFYFYFGLKMGKTAIDKFNSQFFAPCEDTSGENSPISVITKPNSWCSDNSDKADGYVLIDLSNISLPCDIILNSEDNAELGYEFKQWNNEKLFMGDLSKLIKDGKNELGVSETDVAKTDDGQNILVPNGSYELTVTDSEGQINTYNFDMISPKVQFTYSKADNDIPNNQRMDENEAWGALLTNIDKNNYIKYGGYITIDSIINGENPEGTYRLEILFKDSEKEKYNTFLAGYTTSVLVNVDNNGNIVPTTTDNIVRHYDGKLVIITPLGDINYIVRITENCNNSAPGLDISMNFSELYIRVNDTLPYKLFVNDIDVSALNFDDNQFDGNQWQIGWDEAIENPLIDKLGKAWLNLNDEKYYKFEKLDGYEDLTTVEEQTEFKSNFIRKVKQTFWLTSTTSPKDIVITVQTRKLPIKYYFYYNEEESSDKASVNQLVEKGNEYAYDSEWTTNSINDILIPTITSKDNEDYGCEVTNAYNGNISFGYDRINGMNDKGIYVNSNMWIKKPYGIRVMNTTSVDNDGKGTGEKLPSKGNVYFTMDDKTPKEQYFFFHIIDKVLRVNNMIVWSYVNKIPYYGTDVDKRGRLIKMNGLFTGVINNGILDDKTKQFNTFRLGKEGEKEPIKVVTKNGVNDIPTIREIASNTYKDDTPYNTYKGATPYLNYGINYVPVRNSQDTLDIEDAEGNLVSETIYGDMSIKLSSYVDNVLTFAINKGDNSGADKYYLIEGEANYPLNKGMAVGDNGWTKNDDYSIMSKDTKIKDLYEKASTNVQGSTPTDDETEKMDSKGYSTNGTFTIKKALSKFFVVAVTSNNCRTISPLYVNDVVSINAILAELNTIVDNGDGTYDNVVDYKFAVELAGRLPYYINYYNSRLALMFRFNEQLKVEGQTEFTVSSEGMPLDDGDKIAYFDIDNTMYALLKAYFNSTLFNLILRPRILALVTDITNLPLKTSVNSYGANGSRKDILYALIWDTSDFGDNAPTMDLTKYYTAGSVVSTPPNDKPLIQNGYNYKGWQSINKDGYTHDVSFPFTMPSESIILRPHFVKVSFVFNCGGGMWGDDTQVDKVVELNGNTLRIDELPTLKNNTFKTWKSTEFTDYIVSADKMSITITSDIVNISTDKITFIAQFG